MHNRCRQIFEAEREIDRGQTEMADSSKYCLVSSLINWQRFNFIMKVLRLSAFNWIGKTKQRQNCGAGRCGIESKRKNTQKKNRKTKRENNRNNAQRSENSPMKKSSWQAWPRSPKYPPYPVASAASPSNETCTECAMMFVSECLSVCVRVCVGRVRVVVFCSYIEWTKNKNFFPLE